MARTGVRVRGLVCAVAFSVAFLPGKSNAAPLDSRGEMKLGVRTYVNARIGTQATDSSFDSVGDIVRSLPVGDPNRAALAALDQTLGYRKNRTFPYSPAGHLRQNRFFAEVELKHNLSRLQKEGFGPLGLLNLLPFRVRNLSYGLTFRGEYDGIYDWGPSEYRTHNQYVECGDVHSTDNNPRGCLSRNPATGVFVDVPNYRRQLRDNSSRFQLFQAYVDADFGNRLWMRFGRQILSWGETDAFRLLDNINPIDNSFGGFLIALDERRVPLDMLRVQYRLGNIGPAYDTFIELYGAIDSSVGYSPGVPSGSAWGFPNNGVPTANTQSIITEPARNFTDIRGGGRFVFNIGDGTFSLAHYYTYFDVPQVQTYILPTFPVDPARPPTGPLNAFEERYSVRAFQSKQQVQITGASMTFALPSLYSIIRSEIAYFKDEPRFSQSAVDPFIYHYFTTDENGDFQPISPSVLRRECMMATNDLANDPEAMESIQRGGPVPQTRELCRTTGGARTGDSLNMAFGLDINQFIRFLNPQQTFFISTQFFYKHLFGAVSRRSIPGRIPMEGEVLPVTESDFIVNQGGLSPFGAVEPALIKQPTDTFLHTLFITTSYRSGTINPAFTFFYDWGGALVYQPAVTFIYDPFRFSVNYSILDAGTLKAGSGVSLLRDRDNIEFRFEYVI